MNFSVENRRKSERNATAYNKRFYVRRGDVQTWSFVLLLNFSNKLSCPKIGGSSSNLMKYFKS